MFEQTVWPVLIPNRFVKRLVKAAMNMSICIDNSVLCLLPFVLSAIRPQIKLHGWWCHCMYMGLYRTSGSPFYICGRHRPWIWTHNCLKREQNCRKYKFSHYSLFFYRWSTSCFGATNSWKGQSFVSFNFCQSENPCKITFSTLLTVGAFWGQNSLAHICQVFSHRLNFSKAYLPTASL